MAVVLSIFADPSAQQRDPIKNFCRRFGHQTAVVNNKLFIDGGLVNWNPISTYPDNYTSECPRRHIHLSPSSGRE